MPPGLAGARPNRQKQARPPRQGPPLQPRRPVQTPQAQASQPCAQPTRPCRQAIDPRPQTTAPEPPRVVACAQGCTVAGNARRLATAKLLPCAQSAEACARPKSPGAWHGTVAGKLLSQRSARQKALRARSRRPALQKKSLRCRSRPTPTRGTHAQPLGKRKFRLAFRRCTLPCRNQAVIAHPA
jgi:hypothetical protein